MSFHKDIINPVANEKQVLNVAIGNLLSISHSAKKFAINGKFNQNYIISNSYLNIY